MSLLLLFRGEASPPPTPTEDVATSRYQLRLAAERRARVEAGRAAWRRITAVGQWSDLREEVAQSARAYSRGALETLPAEDAMAFDAWEAWRPRTFALLEAEADAVEARAAARKRQVEADLAAAKEARRQAWVAKQEDEARRGAARALREKQAAVAAASIAAAEDDEEAAIMLLLL